MHLEILNKNCNLQLEYIISFKIYIQGHIVFGLSVCLQNFNIGHNFSMASDMGLSYFTYVFLMTSPFNWYQHF